MKKKRLNEGCACEGEETKPTQKKFISGDRVNRYVLQMSEEEQARVEGHPQPFWKVIAGILGTKVENIKSVKREGLGYRVEAVDDMDRLLDDNAKILKRLKDSDDSTYTPDKLDDNFMRKDEEEENKWMTPKEMGIAQKMDWSDDYGDEISDDEKMEYFRSLSDMYEVDMKNGLVRLKPEAEWF